MKKLNKLNSCIDIYLDTLNNLIDVHLSENDLSYFDLMNRELRRVKNWINLITVVAKIVIVAQENVHAKIAKRVSHVPVDAIVSVVRRRAAVLNSYKSIFKVRSWAKNIWCRVQWSQPKAFIRNIKKPISVTSWSSFINKEGSI